MPFRGERGGGVESNDDSIGVELRSVNYIYSHLVFEGKKGV